MLALCLDGRILYPPPLSVLFESGFLVYSPGWPQTHYIIAQSGLKLTAQSSRLPYFPRARVIGVHCNAKIGGIISFLG